MEILNKAFADLRKRGYLARQCFSCCSSCAGYALTQEAVKKSTAGKTVRGCVFYHRQDRDGFNESGTLLLRFGNMTSTQMGVIGIESKLVGDEVIEVLASHGIPTKWSGDPSACIEVYPNDAK
jgi:hypothetical protein